MVICRSMRFAALYLTAILFPSLACAQTWQVPVLDRPQAPAPGPPLTSEQRAVRVDELQAIDARLQVLSDERRKWSLGWPIALIAMGPPLLAVGGLVALEAGARSSYDEDVAGRVFGYFAVPAAALMIGGAVFLGVRVHRRRARAPEMRALERRKQSLVLQLSYRPASAPASLGSLLLVGRF